MLLGAFDLNVAKQQEFEAYQAYPNAVAIVPKKIHAQIKSCWPEDGQTYFTSG